MPVFDPATLAKVAALRARRAAGESLETLELLEVQWPSPDGSIYYATTQVDDVASVAPPVSPIECRLIPESLPDSFLPVEIDSTIGDSEIELEFWDADEVISNLLVTHGEGVKVIPYYYFPQEELMLPVWQGHLRFEDEGMIDILKLKATQGFRSSEAIVPRRAHWPQCQAVFGNLFTTQAEVDEGDCPSNRNVPGGLIGSNDPSTGLPWTYCTRENQQACIDRGINPLYHLSHRTIRTVFTNTQPGGGPSLLITSQGNETNLKEPVRVLMGYRRLYDMKVMAFSVPTPAEEGWYFGLYEGVEGPVTRISEVRITVGGVTRYEGGNPVPGGNYNYRLGNKGQTAVASGITPHGFSGTAHVMFNHFGSDTRNLGAGDGSATAIFDGLSNIRTYTDADTYTEISTDNRAWQIARVLCDKRWGYGLDYASLNIESFIEAAEWCDEQVLFTDTFGTQWPHRRSESHVELIGKKIQQQIEDMCMAGRLSRPFLFNGQIHIIPLRALTEDELDECPVFNDTGEDRNIVWEDGKSTLSVSRKSDLDLPNRIECTFDDEANDWLETPLRPIEDVDAQLAAGRVVGDKQRKINSKKYSLLGVTNEAQAIKMGWSLLDLGPHDEGGLQNNLGIKFQGWYLDTLDLHQEKVIKVPVTRLAKYGFQYFRIKKMERKADLKVELECQAYNETYMATFETSGTPPPQFEPLTVTNAGTASVNGTYGFAGPPDPKPIYAKNEAGTLVYIRWDTTLAQWLFVLIQPSGTGVTLYSSDDDVDTPDLVTTWNVVFGTAPVPTVTSGPPPVVPPPPCQPGFTSVTYDAGALRLTIPGC